MKKVLAMLAASALVAGSYGMTIKEGTSELQLKGSYDAESVSGDIITLGGGYGYFIMDNLEVGGRAAWIDSDPANMWSLGAFAEYNFDIGNEWVPYVGVGIDYANSDPEMGEGTDAAQITGSIGVKYFLTDTLAIDGAFNAKQASDDIYPDDDDMNDVTWNLTLGLRYLIP